MSSTYGHKMCRRYSFRSPTSRPIHEPSSFGVSKSVTGLSVPPNLAIYYVSLVHSISLSWSTLFKSGCRADLHERDHVAALARSIQHPRTVLGAKIKAFMYIWI